METTVPFEKILETFSENGDDYHFLSETSIEKRSEVSKDMVQQLSESGLVCIPRKSREFEKKAREDFIYEIADPRTAEKFFESIVHTEPKKSFADLLAEHSLEDAWSRHKKKFDSNALINWLVKSDIALPGQRVSADIRLDAVEPKSIPEEMRAFVPIACNSCGNSAGFIVKYFKTSHPCENLMMEKEASELLLKEGLRRFSFLGRERKEMMATSICPQCQSEDIEWGFR
jgi:hypothetical protein